MAVTGRRRKHWGWGFEDDQPSPRELRETAAGLAAHLGFGSTEPEAPAPLEAVALPEPRIAVPDELRDLCTQDRHARVSRAQGKSYPDVVRGMRGIVPHPPDAVAFPRDEDDVRRVLGWCAAEDLAVIPYGGGTSVVGGVDARPAPGQRGAVTLDLGGMGGVREVDPVSRSARIGAGATGPALERELAAHGLTLRFYPQSFELSTLGGWIATRAGGHFATGPTHIDDLVEAVHAVTATGAPWASRRLPGSGAGPSPDRLLLGSEGALAVITEAWVRVQPRPERRRGATVRFRSGFTAGADAVRDILQAGLTPAGCRLIDPEEARTTLAGDGSAALLVLGFESWGAPVDVACDAALAICAAHGGAWEERGSADAGAGAWRAAFLRAPYLRDTLVAMGVLVETFETAITWERLPALIGEVRAALPVPVTCRLTHVYPDGAAPYFTVLAPAERGDELEQWQALKAAASDAVARAGGTITHHHAVGRDHRPWYDAQRPDPFAAALRAAKDALDPQGLLNPGVLVG